MNELIPGLLELSPAGLYCPAGDFYIDPWRPVARAVVTHAHSDHACPGSERYLTARSGAELVRLRVQDGASIQPLEYGESLEVNGVRVSLHPAGHILGSAQVRLERQGVVAVVGGDHKLAGDPTCPAFEPQRCHLFVCEATFALPIYRWPPAQEVFAEINAWWRDNQAAGRTSVIFAYALGKAQHVLSGLDPSLGPIAAHGAIRRLLSAYAAAGVRLPAVGAANRETASGLRGVGLILAPPSTADTAWLRQFGRSSTAFASGWMQIRGTRRRRNLDRGFVLSDHADFPDLLETIRLTGAERVAVTHGYTAQFCRYLRECGIAAEVVRTRFSDDEAAETGDAADPDAVPPDPSGASRASSPEEP